MKRVEMKFRQDEDIHEISLRAAERGISRGQLIPQDYVMVQDTRWFELFNITNQQSVHVFDGLVHPGES